MRLLVIPIRARVVRHIRLQRNPKLMYVQEKSSREFARTQARSVRSGLVEFAKLRQERKRLWKEIQTNGNTLRSDDTAKPQD